MLRQQAIKGYNAGIYCRLSKDDGKMAESCSIETQRDMLTRYVREQGWNIYSVYIDDGFTGRNFERPDFKRMIADIEAGRINLVITKDLSRFGRNYLECGVYIEVFFPEHGVRFLALDDNVDSENNSHGGFDITPFRNLLNDLYSRDTSKKVKSALKSRLLQGKFLGSVAPYGYQKSPEDKNLLVVDEATAPIIRRVFDLAKQGLGISRIRRILTGERIPRPAVDSESKGNNYDRFFEGNEENRYTWSNNSVRGILRNPVYAGHLAGYKRPLVSIKSTRRLSALPEEYILVENTHEPIIPPEEWELVQSLITSRRNGVPGNSGYDNIFAGMIKCADCGYAMRTCPAHRRKKENPIDNMGYCCNNWGIYGREACSRHLIEARDLHRVVLEDIRKHAQMALYDDKKLIERVLSKLNVREKTEADTQQKELYRAEKRLAELDKLFARMYEDHVAGNISERNYQQMSERYNQEQIDLDAKIRAIRAKIEEDKAADENAGQWVSRIKEFSGITELSAPLLHSLIDRVTVGEAEIIDGVRHQIVNIYYKFIGRIE